MKTLAEGVDTVWQSKKFRKHAMFMLMGLGVIGAIMGGLFVFGWVVENHPKEGLRVLLGAGTLFASWLIGSFIWHYVLDKDD